MELIRPLCSFCMQVQDFHEHIHSHLPESCFIFGPTIPMRIALHTARHLTPGSFPEDGIHTLVILKKMIFLYSFIKTALADS